METNVSTSCPKARIDTKLNVGRTVRVLLEENERLRTHGRWAHHIDKREVISTAAKQRGWGGHHTIIAVEDNAISGVGGVTNDAR